MDTNNNEEHDFAIQIACEKFDELYPKEMQPNWLKYCMSIKAVKNQDKNWVVKMVLLPKPKRKPNQYLHWEDDGVPILFEVEPITKAKSVVLCGGPAMEPEVFFAVEIDVAKDWAKVIINIDPNELDGTNYEINMRL